ncbi:M14 family metallopeptidase [Deinococcus fonticola]|uniref:M14 family metallopeptidase n=1 Tax=Deinococcus fonticola TaxID=2528713 RepID=UPI001F0F2825|nr:M14 family metallopeptidase [Deinococcus fonticola]
MTIQEAVPVAQLKFPHYHTYDELTQYLEDVARDHPTLARLSSMGKSYQGRDLWVLTLTNTESGPDSEKPGYWIDANIHAGEVTGGAAALWTIEHLLSHYGQDSADGRQATELLDQHALYIAPRLSPDGVEAFLTTPMQVRSSLRPYPFEDEREGLYPHDIDGDGRILQMRVPDPKGPWKVSEKDPRLMRRRTFQDSGAQEAGEQFYQVYGEGLIRDYDGYTVKAAPTQYGLDLNRNFFFDWGPEGQQRGAGPYPASEPETRALADFFARHPNINGAQSYHTYGGVILRPYSGRADDTLPTHDLRVFKQMGQGGTDLTGYPHTSVFHGFRYDPKEVLRGGLFDWFYDSLGIFAFATELWDVVAAAGIGEEKGGVLTRDFIEWGRDHPEEDDLKLLKFNDEQNLGGFEPWRRFEHPQLGAVEIGGWDYRTFWGVAPLKFLEEIADKNARFTLAHAGANPRLNWKVVDVRPQEGGLYHLVAVLENTGFLPTYTSARAMERQAVQPIRVKVQGGRLLSGEATQEIGQLEGRSAVQGGFAPTFARQEQKLEWVIRGEKGSKVTLEAAGQRAGVARAEVELG